jgi:hypothetical protein
LGIASGRLAGAPAAGQGGGQDSGEVVLAQAGCAAVL